MNGYEEFHRKIGRLKLLDPACGCGNFLIISYGELRHLELYVLQALWQRIERRRRPPVVPQCVVPPASFPSPELYHSCLIASLPRGRRCQRPPSQDVCWWRTPTLCQFTSHSPSASWLGAMRFCAVLHFYLNWKPQPSTEESLIAKPLLLRSDIDPTSAPPPL